MSQFDVVRAWKDEDYRMSLQASQRAQLPENPAGMIELTDAELSDVTGAMAVARPFTIFNWCPKSIVLCGTGAGTGGNCSKVACCQKL